MPTRLTIHTDGPTKALSPLIFGGFIEHFQDQIYGGLFEPGSPLSDSRGFRQDVIEAMKELKLSIVRWPGGCFASGYHWRDGVGKLRRPVYDMVWSAEDPNTFGTDEFIEWCRLVGCEPYLCTNAGNGTPREMRDWVEYCNGTTGENARLRMAGRHREPHNVRIWSIGNENWGAWEIGARAPEEWGPLVRESAEQMLAADPKLTLIAAATPEPGWTLPLLSAAGKYLDYVAIHRYWLPCCENNVMPGYLDIIQHAEHPNAVIAQVIETLGQAGCRGRVKIAFDEWNLRGWHHPGFPRKTPSDTSDPAVAALIQNRDKNNIASQYSMADALFSASFLNACLRNADDIGMANIAPIVNTRGPLCVHPKGIVKRTTFHVLAMYANELGDRIGTFELASDTLTHEHAFPLVDAVATTDESGRDWKLTLINRHPAESVSCAIKLGETDLPDGSYPATVLAGDSPDAFNDEGNPDRVTPHRRNLVSKDGRVELAPHSLTVVKISTRNNAV